MHPSRQQLVKFLFSMARRKSEYKPISGLRPLYRFSEENKATKEDSKSTKEEKKSTKEEPKSENPKPEENSKPENLQPEQPPKQSFRQKVKESYPRVGTGLDFCVSAWKQTFPSEKTSADVRKKKRVMAKPLDEDLPEWRKGAMVLGKEKPSVKGKLKSTLESTTYYQSFLKSEQYKKYQEFSKAKGEFQEDLKDHLHNHPNAFVQTSLGLVVRA